MGHAKDIWGHSSEQGTKHYIIFSVKDDEIVHAAFKHWATISDIKWKPLVGSYKGKTERSYLVPAEHTITVAGAGWLAGQESVLCLGTMDSQDRREAKLIFLDEHGWPADDGAGPAWNNYRAERDLGRLVSVSREMAFASDGWSFDPQQNEYFITIDPTEIKIDDEALAKAKQIPAFNTKAVITEYLRHAKSL